LLTSKARKLEKDNTRRENLTRNSVWFQGESSKSGHSSSQEHNQERGREDFCKSGDRKVGFDWCFGTSSSATKNLLSSSFGSKRRFIQNGDRYVSFERRIGDRKDEDGNFVKDLDLDKTRLLYDLNGSRKWLSTCANLSGRLDKVWYKMGGKVLRIHSSAFWLEEESVNIFKSCWKNDPTFEKRWNDDPCFSGRFFDRCFLKGRVVDSKGKVAARIGSIRLEESGSQRLLGTNSTSKISRFGNRHGGGFSSYPKRQNECFVFSLSNFDQEREITKTSVGKSCRKVCQCSSGVSTCSVCCKNDLSIDGLQQTNVLSKFLVESIGGSKTGVEGNSELVQRRRKKLEWETFCGRQNCGSDCVGHGCFRQQIWSGVSGSHNERTLQRRREGSPHWRKGVVDNLESSVSLENALARKEITNKDRQPSGAFISFESRWKDSKAKFVSKKNMEGLHEFQNNSDQTILDLFRGKCDRRLVESWIRDVRLVDRPVAFSADSERFELCLFNRQICKRSQYEMPQVQRSNKIKREECRSNRLFHSRLEERKQLCSCSVCVDRESCKSHHSVSGKYIDNCAKMGGTNLVASIVEDSNRNVRNCLFPEQFLQKQVWMGGASKKSKLDFLCSQDFVSIMGIAWAPSTVKKYLREWSNFKNWMLLNKRQLLPVLEEDLREFLVHLVSFSPSSCNTILAVISITHKINKWPSVTDSEMIRRFVQGAEKLRPKRDQVLPFPVDCFIAFCKLSSGKNKVDNLKSKLIVGLGLRNTFRAETMAALFPSQISFHSRKGVKVMKIVVSKSKTNQNGKESIYEIDSVVDKSICLVHFMENFLELRFGKLWMVNSSDYLFGNNGKQISTAEVSKIVKSVAKAVGDNNKYSSRSLRVGAVDWMIQEGLNWETILSFGWSPNSTAAINYFRNASQANSGLSSKMMKIKNKTT
jgi:hypothetical protein